MSHPERLPAPRSLCWLAGIAALSLGLAACSTVKPETSQPAAVAKPAMPSAKTPAAPKPAAPAPAASSAEQTLNQYRAWIGQARLQYPYADSEDRMYRVMLCESNGRADAVNRAGPYSGLFQYSAGLWKGSWNTYRDQPILDPKAQIFATALAWQKGMQNQWGCYKSTH